MKNLGLLLPPPVQRDTWGWATVTGLSPLRIRLDGESDPLPFTPDALAGPLAIDDRVWVALTTNDDAAVRARRLVIVGKPGGVQAELAALHAQADDERPRWARRTTDGTPANANTTLAADSVLTLPVVASTVYELEAVIHFNSSTTADFKFGWLFPSGLTMVYAVWAQSGGNSLGFGQIHSSTPTIDGHGIHEAALVKGTVTVAATPGDLQLRCAQGTSHASDTTVLAQSYIKLTKTS
jgi:hypothetical protein